MPLHRQRAQTYLQKFDFEFLFSEELGWDTIDRVMLPFEVDGEPFEVVAIAQKRGFTVYQCITPGIPARPLGVKLDRQLTEHSKSRLLVVGDEGKPKPGCGCGRSRGNRWHRGLSNIRWGNLRNGCCRN